MARPSNKEERRSEIAAALIRTMSVQGYDGASISAIAREANLSSGLVHYHFDSKLEILLYALELLTHTHRLRVEVAVRAADTPGRKIAAFIEAHLGLGADADPYTLKCWVQMSAEALRNEHVQAAFGHALTQQRDLLTELIADGFDVDSPIEIAAAIVATIHGYFTLAAVSRELIPAGSAARSTRLMASALLRTEI